MTTTITYRLAYCDLDVSLCAKHAVDYRHPLGPVQHGAHEGSCDECERQYTARARIVRVIWAVPGVDEGETSSIRAAEVAIARARARVGMVPGYLVVCRNDGTRQRVAS